MSKIVFEFNRFKLIATDECRFTNHVTVNNDFFYRSILEHLLSDSGLFAKLNGGELGAALECTFSGKTELRKLYRGESCTVEAPNAYCISIGKIHTADILAGKASALIERHIIDDAYASKVYVFKEHAILECRSAYSLTALGKGYVLKLAASVECVFIDGLNALGNYYRYNGIVTERRLLIVDVVVSVLILFYFLFVIKVVMAERKCAYGHDTLIVWDNNVAAPALIGNERTVFNNELTLYVYRATRRKKRGLAVYDNLKSNSCRALCLSGYYTVLINRYNLGVTCFPLKLVSVGREVPGIDSVMKLNFLGGIAGNTGASAEVVG